MAGSRSMAGMMRAAMTEGREGERAGSGSMAGSRQAAMSEGRKGEREARRRGGREEGEEEEKEQEEEEQEEKSRTAPTAYCFAAPPPASIPCKHDGFEENEGG